MIADLRMETTPTPSSCRIAWLNQFDPYSPAAGGVERSIREIGKRLARLGHELTVISEHYPGADRSGIRDGYHLLRPSGRIGVHLWSMTHLQRSNGASEYDVTIQDQAKIVPWTIPYTRRQVPAVMFLHHLFGKHIMNEVSPLEAFGLMALERFVPWLERDCEWITETEFHQKLLLRVGVPRERIHVIRPGVDFAFFVPDSGIRSPTPIVTYSGRLRRYKRVDLAIKAVGLLRKKWPTVRLVIAGSGPEEERLRRLVSSADLQDAVQFLGQVSEPILRETYRRAWVNVQPSAVEGWGFTILEAAACGTPSVTFRNSVFPETIGPHCQGYLADEGNVSSLVDKLDASIGDMESEAGTKADQCVAYARRFDWDTTASEYSHLLEFIAEARHT